MTEKNNLRLIKNLDDIQLKNLIEFRRRVLKKVYKDIYIDMKVRNRNNRYRKYINMNLSLNEWLILLKNREL